MPKKVPVEVVFGEYVPVPTAAVTWNVHFFKIGYSKPIQSAKVSFSSYVRLVKRAILIPKLQGVMQSEMMIATSLKTN